MAPVDVVRAGGLIVGQSMALGLATAALAEAGSRIGAGLLPFVHRKAVCGGERFGLPFLAGWTVLAPALLGLAATGLFHPVLVLALPVALLFSSRGALARRPFVADALAPWWRVGRAGQAVLATGAACLVVRLLPPEMEHDSYVYHLGQAWQFLRAHRLLIDWVPFPFLVPLPHDLTLAIPMVLGEERLTVWLSASCFLAASAVWAERSLARGGRTAAWLGPATVLACATPLWLAATSKNDMAASALFVTAAVLARAGAWPLAACLAGAAVANKFVYGPLVVAWFLAEPAIRRRWIVAGLLICLPSVPWWARTWVATGNPLHPFGSRWIPTFGWDARNEFAYLQHQLVFWLPDTMRLADLPGAWWKYMRFEYLPVALVLPGLLLAGRTRALAAAVAASQVVTLGAGHVVRYLMPGAWLLALLGTREAERLAPKWRRAAAVVLGGWAVFNLLFFYRNTNWQYAVRPVEEVRKEHLGTYGDALAILARERPRRAIGAGDIRVHKWPCRVLYGGVSGESPLIWQLAGESRSPAELRKKYRQLGVDLVLYNFVSAEWLQYRYDSFRWDIPRLQLYREFCRRYLMPVAQTETSDYVNGGFCLFRIVPRPQAPAPKMIWFMPGTDSLYSGFAYLIMRGRHEEAAREGAAIVALLPDVGQAASAEAHARIMLAQYERVFVILKPWIEAGMRDGLNYPEFGDAAVKSGKSELGERVLLEAWERYPTQRWPISVSLAGALTGRAGPVVQSAFADIVSGRRAAANSKLVRVDGLLAEALRRLEEVPAAGDAQLSYHRAVNMSAVLGLMGEVAGVRGNREAAVKLMRRAFDSAPEERLRAHWAMRLKRISPLGL